MKRKKRRRWFLAFPVVIAAAGAGIYYYGSIQGAEDTSVQTASDLTYRKEKQRTDQWSWGLRRAAPYPSAATLRIFHCRRLWR